MAVYELKTFSDIYTAVREELKIQSADTTTINRIKRNINIVYLDEVCAKEKWQWLRKSTDLTQEEYYTDTCTVTEGSRSVTLDNAITNSMCGYKFSVNEKVYKIGCHTANTTTVELEAEYTDTTNNAATYKIWRDFIPLPNECDEVEYVYLSEKFVPLELVNLHAFRRTYLMAPKEESDPRIACLYTQAQPAVYSEVTGSPNVTKRGSDGLLKTLTFNDDPSDYFPVGSRIKVFSAGNKTYNGEYVVSSVNATSNIITYTGTVNLKEATSTAETNAVVYKETVEGANEIYQKLLIHPSITDTSRTLHVDWVKLPIPLENDSDEPLIPLKDRSVLLYGALRSSWVRERNEEVADRNERLFNQKLAEMRGRLTHATEQPKLQVSKQYLAVKRRRVRLPYDFKRIN